MRPLPAPYRSLASKLSLPLVLVSVGLGVLGALGFTARLDRQPASTRKATQPTPRI